MMKRRNSINEQFSARLISMLESPSYQALSLNGHKVISRIEIELAHHGGNDNGKLPVTYQDFIDYGISRESVPPAIREAVALGFIKITRQGHGGNAEFRESSLYLLTFAYARGGRHMEPPHDWSKIKTVEEAQQIAAAARSNKNPTAIKKGKLAVKKNKNRFGKSVPVPVRESRTEKSKSPIRESRTTGSVRNPVLLSISRGGEPAGDASSSSVYSQPASSSSSS